MHKHLSLILLSLVCLVCLALPSALADVVTGIAGPFDGFISMNAMPVVVGGYSCWMATTSPDPNVDMGGTFSLLPQKCIVWPLPQLGGGSDYLGFTSLFPGDAKLMLVTPYMPPDPSLPTPPSTTVYSAVFTIQMPNNEDVSGVDDNGNSGPVAVGTTTPIVFTYFYYDGSNAYEIMMDATTAAEEQLHRTTMFNNPVNITVPWGAKGSPNFQFSINNITDNKGMIGMNPPLQEAWPALPDGFVVSGGTQTNRLDYFDVCGNPQTKSYGPHPYAITKITNPNDPNGFYVNVQVN